MALTVCTSCGKQTPDWRPTCDQCGVAITARGRKQQESAALADRITARAKDPGYAAWQRTVIMDVVHGGGLAGFLLILATVAVCTVAFLATHRLVSRVLTPEGSEPRSGGILLYLAIVLPITVLFFRLTAPLFYRLHVRLTRQTPSNER